MELRSTLFGLIARYPGLHLRELARQANTSEALTGYHVRHFLEAGTVEGVTDGYYLRLFPVGGRMPERDKLDLAVLRRKVPLEIVRFILERQEATHGELAAHLGIPKSTVSYHLRQLTDRKLLVQGKDSAAWRLENRQRMVRLLAKWTPPARSARNFEATWSSLYGKPPRKGK